MPGTADTAKLLASLELQDKFSGPAAKAMGSVTKLETSFDRIGAAAKRGVGVAAANLTRLGLVAAAGISGAIFTGLQDLKTLESATTSVDGAIRQLGLTGQVTGAQVADWANQIEANIGAAFDDKAITAATATLIRFGKVTGPNLRPAMVVMTDLAAKTGSVDAAASLLAKALADPEKAAGKLARTGVVLTKAQQDQIKALVKAGEVTKAQAFLLDQLEQTTKGAAAATQGPYARAISMLADASEDARKALAIGFLPVIEKVATKLSTALANPQVIASIRDFGMALAGSLDSLIGIAERLPWGSIADSLKIAGAGAKLILDAFVSMPPWVQTAVLTGWGLNKLTGGALGDIVGELGKGLIKGVLGMNAGVVNINAGVVNGAGGLPGAAGAAGGMGLGAVAALAAGGGLAIAGIQQVGSALGDAFTSALSGNSQLGQIVGRVLAGATPGAPDIIGTLDDIKRFFTGENPRQSIGQMVAQGIAEQNRANPLALSPDARDRANEARKTNAELAHLTFLQGEHTSYAAQTAKSVSGMVAALDKLHTDLLTQIGILKMSGDPKAIAAAAAATAKDVLAGAGGVTSTGNILADLKAARSKVTDAGSLKIIDSAISKVADRLKTREWVAAQKQAADRIVKSNASTATKISELKAIERSLQGKSHLAMEHVAAEIDSLKPKLDAITTAVHGIRLPAGQTPTVNSQTGFTTGGTKIVVNGGTSDRSNYSANTKVNRWTPNRTMAQ